MDLLTDLHKRVGEEPWVSHITIRIWGHGLYGACIFDHQGSSNGSGVYLDARAVEGLIKSRELQMAEPMTSWSRGMGDGYFVQKNKCCSWDDVGYTVGIKGFEGDATVENVMCFLKGRFDALVERLEYLERIKEEHRLLVNCGVA